MNCIAPARNTHTHRSLEKEVPMRLAHSPALLSLCVVAFLPLARPLHAGSDKGSPIQMEVDARDLPRRLMHTRLVIPCQSGKLRLWFPKWIPGYHSPAGPVGDIAGLRVEAPDGKVIPWQRDEVERYCVTCEVLEGVREVRVK